MKFEKLIDGKGVKRSCGGGGGGGGGGGSAQIKKNKRLLPFILNLRVLLKRAPSIIRPPPSEGHGAGINRTFTI